MLSTKVKGYLLAVSSAIFYGIIPLFILPMKKIGYSTDTTLFYRFTLAALFLLLYLLVTKKSIKIKTNELFIPII